MEKQISSASSSFSFAPSLMPPWRKLLISLANEECKKALAAYYFLSSIKSTKDRLDPTALKERHNKAMADSFWDSPENFMELSQKMVSSHPQNGYGYLLGSIGHFRVLFNKLSFSEKDWEIFDMALSLAENAANHAPNSVEYCLFYASLLFMRVQSVKVGYEQVIEECERGLYIANPQDPTYELIWSKEPGKERNSEEIGLWTRFVSEYMKRKITVLMEAVKDEKDGEEISVVEDIVDKQDDFLIIVPRQTKKNVDARYMPLEALKLCFASPIEPRNVKDASPVHRSSISADDHKKIPADDDKKSRIMEFWREMSDETKLGLLTVNIAELEQHFSLLKNELLVEVLNAAIEYVKKERKWVHWICYACDKEMFADSELWRNHVKSEHLEELEPQFQEMEPELASDEWTKTIENGVWKPMDLTEISGSGSGLESKASVEDNKKRKDLIRSVHGLMKSLMTDKCLALSHVEKLMSHLQTCFTEQRVVDYRLDSICFLNVSQLKKVIGFLKDWAFFGGLISYKENVVRDLRHVLCVEERIFLSIDLLSLVLDKRSFPEAPYTGTWITDPEEYQSVIFSADANNENIEFPDSDAFVNWLFSGPTLEEHLDRLKILKEGSTLQVNNLLKTVEEQFEKLKVSCREKAKLKSFVKELDEAAAQSEETEEKKEELGKLDAEILAGVRFRRQALQKLELLCCWDYRIDMVCLLKMFILARMEEQLEKQLEAQRKFEEEAREKALAEQKRKADADKLSSVHTKPTYKEALLTKKSKPV